MDDGKIIFWYDKGFMNELNGANDPPIYTKILLKAYNLGKLHAKLGDDVRSFDYLTDEDILKEIKNGKENC